MKYILLLFVFTSSVHACLWDYDTIQMERQRFPDALELITGKFLRHSSEYYQWRVQDRLQKLEANDKELAYYDDLAVAYDKLGQHEKAISVMYKKEKQKPGLYETYANLGTFYIHAKQYNQGLVYIDKAILINPDAHFGREIYQKYLVEYILTRHENNKIKLPLIEEKTDFQDISEEKFYQLAMTRPQSYLGFSDFLKEKQSEDFSQEKAIKGILGMMRFGNFESPILLEVLAHLLLDNNNRYKDGKLLASRALLKASYAVEDPVVKSRYTILSKNLARQHESYREMGLEKQFAKELQEAQAYFSQIEKDEKNWIANKMDVDQEYSQKYYNKPQMSEKVNYYNAIFSFLGILFIAYHIVFRCNEKRYIFITSKIGKKFETVVFRTAFFVFGLSFFFILYSRIARGASFMEAFWY